MRHRAAVLGCVVAAALLAQSAAADLITVDLLAPGDGLVTRDTDTGLDWLDLGGLTTNLSYDQVIAGAGGWATSGWRHATEAEVCHLWVTHGGAPSCNSNSPGIPLPAAAQAMMTQLGTTENVVGGGIAVVRVNGLYDDASAPATSVGLGRIEVSTFIGSGIYTLTTSAAANAVASDASAATRGSFLVRATPPVIPALPLAGGAALALLLVFATRRGFER